MVQTKLLQIKQELVSLIGCTKLNYLMVGKAEVLASERNNNYLKNQRLAEDFKKKRISWMVSWECQAKEDSVLSKT